MKSPIRARLLASSLLISATAFAMPAYAQETTLGGEEPAQTSADDSEQDGGSVVVTGSRIARPDLEAVSPVTSVGAEQIELTGTVTLETLINDLPQVIPGNNRTSNNSGGESFATLDLRGLGPNRNLILVDGERLAASSTTGTVDISQIPTALIERIDVVTGGATAVYGSDAISGVVNFVLKDNFEGLELTAQNGIAQDGIAYSFNLQGVFGANFADGRGNFTLSASYFDRDGVSQGRYDYSRTSAALAVVNGVLVPVDSYEDLGSDGEIIFAGGSATTPFGQVVNSATNPFGNLATVVGGNFASFNTDCNAATANVATNGGSISFDQNGNIRPFATAGLCGIPIGDSSRYNFAPDNLLSIPFDRMNFAGTARYEFSDRTTARFYSSYTRTESTANLAPTPAAAGTGFNVSVDAPAIPDDLAAALATRPNPNAPFLYNRRFNETGPRIGITESEAYQLRAIVDHQLSDNWSVSAVGSYGRSEVDSRGIGNINRTAVEQGLNGCVNSAGVVNGAGILPGCVTVDIFGANSLTPAMVSFIQTDTFDASTFEQVRAAVNVSGTLFEIVPNDPIGVAFGAEYRKDTGESIPDDAKRRGEIIGFNQANPLGGSIDVKEVYGEIRIPLLGGGTGFPDLLSVEGGARYSSYSSVGELFNYKVGLEFAPFDFLRFRGAYNKAARAPSVFELFQNGDQGFPSVTDPCNEVNAARDEAFCVAQGVPAGELDGFAQANQQVQAFAFGNPNLSEENAETYTAGVVVAPNYFPLGRFSATVDYYDITINDLNAAQGAQFFLNDCYNNQNQTSCDRVVRNAGTGQIERVNTTRVNSDDPLSTNGIDVGLNWVIPLGDIFAGSTGRLRLSELFTWVNSYKIGETEFVDTAAPGIGGVTSRYASTLTVAYEEDMFTVQGRWVYKSGGDQGSNLFGSDEETGFTTPRVPDLNTFDLNIRVSPADNFDLTFIVQNLLDEYAPQTATGVLDQANTNAAFFTPLIFGRTFTAQARVRF